MQKRHRRVCALAQALWASGTLCLHRPALTGGSGIICFRCFPTSQRPAPSLLAASCVYILIRCQVFISIPLDFIFYFLYYFAGGSSSSQPCCGLGHSGEWGGELGGKLSWTGRLGHWSPWPCGLAQRPPFLPLIVTMEDGLWVGSKMPWLQVQSVESEQLTPVTFCERDMLIFLLGVFSTKTSYLYFNLSWQKERSFTSLKYWQTQREPRLSGMLSALDGAPQKWEAPKSGAVRWCLKPELPEIHPKRQFPKLKLG